MVTYLSERRFIMLFSEALTEPLWGLVKAYKPSTLQDPINKTRELQDSVPKNRFPTKTNFPIKDKEKKPFQQEWPKKTWLDDDTRKDLRKKKIVFYLLGTMGSRQ